MPGNDAITRLFQLQQTPAPAGTTAQDIARLLAMAAQQQQVVDQAPMQRAVADVGYGFVQQASPDQPVQLPQYIPPPPSPPPPAQMGVPTADPTAPHPESLLEPLVEGSAVQGPQEATPLNPPAFDAQTGEAVFTAPGVPGEIRIPLNITEGAFDALMAEMSNRWRGADVFGPIGVAAVTTSRANDIAQAYARLREQLIQQAPGAPTGPLTQTSVAFERSMGAPVSPEHLAELARARAAEEAAQRLADQAQLGVVDARTQGFGQRGNFLGAQGLEQRGRDQEIESEFQRRMAELDQTLRRVQSNQISPDSFFGPGVAGRIIPAIAVALGELGRGLTGDPTNRALQIIDSAVNRSMEAQARNQQADLQSAQLQGQALQHFRTIVGDQRGAEAATKAALYQAFINQIDAQMSRAQGVNLAGLQQLRAAVLQRMQAEGLVAQDAARFQSQVRIETTHRQRGGPTAEDASRAATIGAMASDAAQAQAQPQRSQGLVQPGNIDVSQQPRIRNMDGSVSNVLSMSFNDGPGREVLIPMVSHEQPGRILTEDQAIEEYRRTGRHLGVFSTPEAATQYAQQLHEQQGALDLPPQYDASGRPLQDAPSAAAQAMGGTIGTDGSIELEGGIRIPRAVLNPLSPQAQDVLRAAQQRLAQDPSDRRAREIVTSGRRRARESSRRVERTVRRQLPRYDLRQLQRWDVQDARHAMERIERRARGGTESGPVTPAVLPTGFRFLTPEDGYAGNPERQFQYMAAQGSGQINNLYSAMDMVAMLDSFLPTITAARAEFQGEISDKEPLMVRATAMAADFRSRIMNIRTGANFGPEERDMYFRMMPDPSTITLSNVTGMWDRIQLAWENFQSTFNTGSRAVLRQWAVTTDSTTSNARIRRRALREQEEANQAAEFDRDMARTLQEASGMMQDAEADAAFQAHRSGNPSRVIDIIRRARGHR